MKNPLLKYIAAYSEKFPIIGKICPQIAKIYHAHPPSPLFVSALIETYGYCNRSCAFCFNSKRFPDRDTGIMKENLWIKIIDELSSLHYTGRISPHFYGEPLMDKRMPQLIAYARKKCPESYILIATNGDILTEPLLLQLVEKGVNQFTVTNYDDIEKDHLRKLSEKYSSYITYRSYQDITLKNRAGTIFNNRDTSISRACLRPSRQLVINWKGNILL